MVNVDNIAIEIAYANVQRQMLVKLSVPAKASVAEAIQQSGILKQFPEIDLSTNKIGIFSKLTTLDAPLRMGDRIEIYHPLLLDPKQARIQRAKQQKENKVD